MAQPQYLTTGSGVYMAGPRAIAKPRDRREAKAKYRKLHKTVRFDQTNGQNEVSGERRQPSCGFAALSTDINEIEPVSVGDLTVMFSELEWKNDSPELLEIKKKVESVPADDLYGMLCQIKILPCDYRSQAIAYARKLGSEVEPSMFADMYRE